MPNTSSNTPEKADKEEQGVFARACLALSVSSCIAIGAFLAVALPWYFTLSPTRQFQWFWPFLWILISLTVVTLAGASPTMFLPGTSGPRASSAALFCLVFGLTSLVLFTPALFLTLSLLGTSGAAVVAKTTQTVSDLAAVGDVVDLYREETDVYPPWTLDPSRQLTFVSGKPLPTFQALPDGSSDLFSLADSHTDCPRDPFGPQDEPGSVYAYWAPPGGKGYIVLGRGPNGKFDIDFETLRKEFDPSRADQPGLTALTYDATNGLVSAGDLWMRGQSPDSATSQSESVRSEDDTAAIAQDYVYDPSNGATVIGGKVWRVRE